MIILLIIIVIFPLQHVLANSVQEEENTIWLDKLEVDRYSLNYLDHLFIDEIRLDNLIRTLKDKVHKEPENAKLNKSGEIIPEKLGVTLDIDKFTILFRKTFYQEDAKGLQAPLMNTYPRIDRALLEEIYEKELGSYVTHFKKSNEERSHNIYLATKAINNYVIFPGEVFSFNDVVGERTKERGYKRAPVIVKGELAEDIGGGICQVSSTLFNAVDLRGIQIVERYAHSRSVPYVPEGRDATVSWWGPDFVFRNMYNQPLLIRANSDNGKMLIQLYTSASAEYFTGK
ncbi:VanW family protein [Virgibacillus sp. C22-A2]|uniref:VanW family protein n=1 Tax=Virgibacillus tibetensis TaxID=3042313 RepID=A0ABU6KIV9_9BACI|nr:VanW family protein [Virgibacillus sp. C22-A2]